MQNITNISKLEEFHERQPHIADFQHNFMNGLLIIVNQGLYAFVKEVRQLYESQLSKSKILINVCIVFTIVLILIQIPFTIYVNSIIDSQTELFLKIPIEQCRQIGRAHV